MDKIITSGKAITVLMPVYNASNHLKEAMDSILNQTYSDFYFLIINDGSTDNSEEIIRSYTDPRILYLKNETNSGIVKTLNKGLERIDTEYIVRMDSDDIAVKERLFIQKEFMDQHPEVGVCSSYFETFGNESNVIRLYSSSEAIKANLLFGSQICHPAAIIRTAVLKRNNLNYRSVYPHMEDYDLWYRLKDKTDFANIQKVLLNYRISGANVTIRNYDTLLERKFLFYKDILRSLDIELTRKDFDLHHGFETNKEMPVKERIIGYRNWLQLLQTKNNEKKIVPVEALKKNIASKWKRVFYESCEYGLATVINYWKVSKRIHAFEIRYLVKHFLKKILQPQKSPKMLIL